MTYLDKYRQAVADTEKWQYRLDFIENDLLQKSGYSAKERLGILAVKKGVENDHLYEQAVGLRNVNTLKAVMYGIGALLEQRS